MKKIISALLSVVLVCSMAVCFSACGSSNGSSSSATKDSASSTNSKKITSSDDLKGANIGVQLGTTGDIYASDYEKEGATIQRFNKGADAVLALSQGKIDCVIIDSEPAKSFVKATSGIKILDEPFAEEDYAICLAKDKTDLTKDFNKALGELKKDGTLDSIIANYIGDSTKGKSPYETPDGTDASKGELHMATNAFFEPYEFYSNKKVVGIDPMIAQAICDKLGYKLVVDDMDFDAIITAVQSGKSDFGMAGMTVTDERKQAVNFTDSYTTATQVIIVKE